jgi:arylsulfatase A-like enzyme
MLASSRSAVFVLLVALCAALAASCRRDEPGWQRLAHGFRPAWLEDPGFARQLAAMAERDARLVREGDMLWIEAGLTRADWKPTQHPAIWRASLPVVGIGRTRCGISRLLSDEGEFEAIPGRISRADRVFLPAHEGGEEWFKPGAFWAPATELYLYLGEGEPPAASRIGRTAASGGASPEGMWRVIGRRYSGDALAVRPGERAQITAEVSGSKVLRFATVLESALVLGEGAARENTFRVSAGGRVLFEHVQAPAEDGTHAWHSVALPDLGRSAELVFEVDGPFAFTAFLAPVIAPAPDELRGRDRRPDIIVVLADTFRADSMAAYGGEEGLTPRLDELARETLCFSRAWSVGTYTLPAHASMFTGLFPRQSETADLNRRLPDELETIAETLSRAGYRTAAVTDSAVVSQAYHLDQGFEWFDEVWLTADSTVDRALELLEQDDGRPLFLFVHSYRTHKPYRVSDETRRAYADVLGLAPEDDFDSIHARIYEVAGKGRTGLVDSPEARRLFAKLERLYRGGVVDLDRALGRFFDELRERRFLDDGYLLFTSDHGEAFFEHAQLYHSGHVFDEQIRVPLLLAGPGVEPGTNELAASLIDLSPTLADMAGLDAQPQWLGRSLLSLDQDRPVFAFECGRERASSTLAMIEGERKVIGYEDLEALRTGALFGAFDLGRDPGELSDLAAGETSWPGDLLERLARAAEPLLTPIVSAQAAELGEAQLEDLRAMGYAGGD